MSRSKIVHFLFRDGRLILFAVSSRFLGFPNVDFFSVCRLRLRSCLVPSSDKSVHLFFFFLSFAVSRGLASPDGLFLYRVRRSTYATQSLRAIWALLSAGYGKGKHFEHARRKAVFLARL